MDMKSHGRFLEHFVKLPNKHLEFKLQEREECGFIQHLSKIKRIVYTPLFPTGQG